MEAEQDPNETNDIIRWRFFGIISITILGFLLHYAYSWSGSSNIIALFVPVNESVWEHLKLGYGAVAIFSMVEYFRIKDRVNNYFTAKLAGLLALEMTILIIFYTYTSVTGEHLLVPDVLSYVAGTVVCQYVTHVIFRLKPLPRLSHRLSVAACIATMVLFGVATCHPPHTALFRDHNSNAYGIPVEK